MRVPVPRRLPAGLLSRLAYLLAVCLSVGCAPSLAQADLPTPVAPAETPVWQPISAGPQTRSPLPTPLPSPSARPSLTPSPAPSPTPSAVAGAPPVDPYAGLSIATLAQRSYGGGLIEIRDMLLDNGRFSRYLISYPSDGLTIYGHMDVPNEGWDRPLALVLHGYMPTRNYSTVTYTERYAAALAESGYFVIHPNFRNHPPSDSGPDEFRVGFAVDVLNLIAIIREQSQDALGVLRRADENQIHLWGHSMGGGIALRVITVNNQEYLRGAVLYAAMSGEERLNYARIAEWSGGRDASFELAASSQDMRAISPIYHLDRVRTAISIHHGSADLVVPLAWSDDLCLKLTAAGRAPECYAYAGSPHLLSGPADALFMQRVLEFFNRV